MGNNSCFEGTRIKESNLGKLLSMSSIDMISEVIPKFHIDFVEFIVINPSELNEILESQMKTVLEILCEFILI